MPLDIVGFRAVIENLQGYIAGTKNMEQANARLAKAQLQVEQASNRVSDSQDNFARRIQKAQQRAVDAQNAATAATNAARSRLVDAEEAVASQIARAQQRVDRARKADADSKTKSVNEQIKANERLKASEAELARIQAAGDRRINRAAAAVTATQARGAVSVGRAQGAVQELEIGGGQAAIRDALALKIAQENLAIAGGKVNRGFSLATAAIKPFQVAMAGAHATTNLLGKALIAVTGFSNRFAVSLKFGAVALGAFLTAFTIGQASGFEDQLVKIDNLTNLTTEDTEKLGKEILDLSKVLPKSPQEIGATAYQVLSSGIQDLDTAMQIVENSTKAATIAQSNSADVAKTTTAVIKAYGQENISAAQITDILIAATREGRVEFADFSQEIGRLLGLAPTLGVEFDELAAALATLSNFLPASQAGTALLGVLNQLFSPSQQAREEFERLGTSVEQFRANVADKGLIPALDELLTAAGNNQQVFERLFPEVRGLGGALLLLRDGGNEANQTLERIRQSAGITDSAFEKANKTFSSQVQLLKNQLSIIFIQMGSRILPALTAKVQELIRWIEKNRDAIEEWIVAFAKAGALIAESVIRGIAAIIKAFDTFLGKKEAIIAAIAAIGLAIVIALGPGSAALLAVVGIIGLLGSIEKFGQGVADKINSGLGLKTSTSGSAEIKKVLEEGISQGIVDQNQLADFLKKSGAAPSFAVDEITKSFISKLNAEAAAKQEAAEATEAQNKAIEDAEIKLKEVERAYADQAESAGNAEEITSALSDGIIDFSEAAELGLSAIAAGGLEAGKLQEVAATRTFAYIKALSLVANALQRSESIAKRVVLGLARTALEATRSAASALFSRPTREIARLELALVRLKIANDGAINSLEKRLSDFDRSVADQDASRQLRDLQRAVSEAEDPDQRRDAQRALADFSRDRSIQKQREAIQAEIDRRLESEQKIQDEIDARNLQTEALQKQIEAADATLLSQGELSRAAQEVTRNTAEQSRIVRELSEDLGIHVIPEMEDMRVAVAIARGAFDVLTNEYLQGRFLSALEVASGATNAVAKSAEEAKPKVDALGDAAQKAAEFLNNFTPPGASGGSGFENGSSGGGLGGGGGSRFSNGGFVFQPSLPATLHGPEVVLPLSKPARSRELISSIPPSIAAQIGLGSQGPAYGSLVDMSVQGYVPVEVENMAVRTVRRQLAKSRTSIRNHGQRI